MKRFVLYTTAALLCAFQVNALTQGEYNRKVDERHFQNKCGSCHSIGLVTRSRELLPSEVWCLVDRMAHYDGANMYWPEQNCCIYSYIVNSIAKGRKKELERALNCLPSERRSCEEQAIEEAKNRYK